MKVELSLLDLLDLLYFKVDRMHQYMKNPKIDMKHVSRKAFHFAIALEQNSPGAFETTVEYELQQIKAAALPKAG